MGWQLYTQSCIACNVAPISHPFSESAYTGTIHERHFNKPGG